MRPFFKVWKIRLWSACLLSCALLTAGAETGSDPVQALEAFLASTQSFKTDFEQVSIDESGQPAQTSSGIFLLSRPGKFRWEYQKPFRQEIVSNGNKVWFYDVDLEQVTVRKQDLALGSAPALLLSGQVRLDKSFHVQNLPAEGHQKRFKLIPKSENSGFQHVILGMEQQVLKYMELSDHFGQLTRIRFFNTENSAPMEAQAFQFTPPPGVDVFEE